MLAVILVESVLSILLFLPILLRNIAMAHLAPLVVPALKKHTATVIWAHGLGDSYVKPYCKCLRLELTLPVVTDGEIPLSRLICPFMALMPNRLSMAENYRRRGKFEEVAFIFPNAPNIPITVVYHSSNDTLRHFKLMYILQNFGMQMPGWYDIVRIRDAHVRP